MNIQETLNALEIAAENASDAIFEANETAEGGGLDDLCYEAQRLLLNCVVRTKH